MAISNLWSTLRAHGRDYWIKAFTVIALGVVFGVVLNQSDLLLPTRYKIYQMVQGLARHSPTHAARTVLILIDDEDYWKGELARRRPLKRDYLAKLIKKLDEQNVWVIGLDVDLSSRVPEHSDYAEENQVLLTAIKEVSDHRPIVLTRRLFRDTVSKKYSLEPTIFSDVKFGQYAKEGFVDVDQDIRRIPLTVRLSDGHTTDSFAAAIVRCVDPRAMADAVQDDDLSFPFGIFISNGFETISSDELLGVRHSLVKFTELEHKVVIVGGSWHEDMFERGRSTDEHISPVGLLKGAAIHGNYVEALLASRTYRPWREWIANCLEIILSLILAVSFASIDSLWRQLLAALAIASLVFLLTILSLVFLGRFFDAFAPSVLVALHAVYERLEWKGSAGARHA